MGRASSTLIAPGFWSSLAAAHLHSALLGIGASAVHRHKPDKCLFHAPDKVWVTSYFDGVWMWCLVLSVEEVAY